jgi:hypothetical protein
MDQLLITLTDANPNAACYLEIAMLELPPDYAALPWN